MATKETKNIVAFTPRAWQQRLFEIKTRFMVLVLHRRAGKTVFALWKLILDALNTPNGNYAYIGPYKDQAKKVAWKSMDCSLKEFVIGLDKQAGGHLLKSINETELTITLTNGSTISLQGADNPNALRGMGFNGVVLDEVADMPEITWADVIRPALMDRKGWAVFIGTPKGHNHFYKLYKNQSEGLKDWHSELLTVDDTDALDALEVQSMKDERTKAGNEEAIQQELYCSFEAGIKGAYYSKQIEDARNQKRVTNVPHNQAYPVHTAWDLGIRDATAIWFFQLVANEIRIINYKEYVGTGLEDIIESLEKVENENGSSCNYEYGYHVAPHDIRVKEFSTGKTRFETASELGIYFEIAEKLSPKDGINAVRKIFQRCIFDANNCAEGLEALSLYKEQIDRMTGAHTGRPEHGKYSHGADSFRYLAVHVDELPRHNDGWHSQDFANETTTDSDWDAFA